MFRSMLIVVLVLFALCAQATPGVVTKVDCSTTSVTLATVYGSRKGLYVYNDDTKNLRLKLGAGASTTSFFVLMLPGAFYELPENANGTMWGGPIAGIWEAACTGSAYVMEQ